MWFFAERRVAKVIYLFVVARDGLSDFAISLYLVEREIMKEKSLIYSYVGIFVGLHETNLPKVHVENNGADRVLFLQQVLSKIENLMEKPIFSSNWNSFFQLSCIRNFWPREMYLIIGHLYERMKL